MRKKHFALSSRIEIELKADSSHCFGLRNCYLDTKWIYLPRPLKVIVFVICGNDIYARDPWSSLHEFYPHNSRISVIFVSHVWLLLDKTVVLAQN